MKMKFKTESLSQRQRLLNALQKYIINHDRITNLDFDFTKSELVDIKNKFVYYNSNFGILHLNADNSYIEFFTSYDFTNMNTENFIRTMK